MSVTRTIWIRARSAPCSFEIVAKGFSLHYFRSHPCSWCFFRAESLYLQERVCLKKRLIGQNHTVAIVPIDLSLVFLLIDPN